MSKEDEVFISVDVETAGPIPVKYSMFDAWIMYCGSTTRDF